ncbi:ESCRT-II subunit protein snf8 [Cichlidogyrus casuarinus]|uniref:ESCRT-II subunit protein snf8 n=1 Tax=Cichlidogyrus casuarinus TaxID=1844966 RepID=A0ABD2QAA0_9PLAT
MSRHFVLFRPITTLNVTLPDVILPINDPQAMHALLAEMRERKAQQSSIRRESADIARSELNLRQLSQALGSDWPVLAQELGLDPQQFMGPSQDQSAYAMLLCWKATATPEQGTGTKLSHALNNIGLNHVLKQCMQDVHLVMDVHELDRAITDLKPEIDTEVTRYVNGFGHTEVELRTSPRLESSSGIGTFTSTPSKMREGEEIEPTRVLVGNRGQVGVKTTEDLVGDDVKALELKHQGMKDFEEMTEDMTRDFPMTHVSGRHAASSQLLLSLHPLTHFCLQESGPEVEEDLITAQDRSIFIVPAPDNSTMQESPTIHELSQDSFMSAPPAHYKDDDDR